MMIDSPVTPEYLRQLAMFTNGNHVLGDALKESADTIEQLRAKLAALREQEPVAWIVEHDDYPTEVELINELDHAPEARKKDEAMGWRFTPLYAAPQPAIPEECGVTNPSGHTALYFDLLMRVQKKVPGETRHETASRIIEQHENGGCQPMLAAQQESKNAKTQR